MTKMQDAIDFSAAIERIVEDQNITYLDALQDYMEQYEIECDMIPKLLTPRLKQRIHEEAIGLNLLGKKMLLDFA